MKCFSPRVLSPLFLFLSMTLHYPANARQSVGEFYPLGQTSGTSMYTQTTTVKVDAKNHAVLDSVIVDPTNKVLMTEKAEYEGFRPITQTIEQRQKKELFELQFADGALRIKRSSLAENPPKVLKDAKSNVSDTLLTGPVTENFVVEHWDELVAGKTIEARFAVMEIADTIHFNFRKVSSDDKGLTVEMKPSGMFIRMFAGLAGLKPIQITVDAKTKHVVRYHGRTPLMDKDNKPLDCEIIYHDVTEGPHL